MTGRLVSEKKVKTRLGHTMTVAKYHAVFRSLMEVPEPFTSHQVAAAALARWNPDGDLHDVQTYARGRITVLLADGWLACRPVQNRRGTASAAHEYRRKGDWSKANFVLALQEAEERNKATAAKAAQAARKAAAEAPPVWNEATFEGGYEAFRATLNIKAPEVKMAGVERHEL